MGRKASNKAAFSPDLVALCFLVAMVLWFNDEIVRGGQVPFFGDLGPYFYPMRFSLAQSFRSGELPLWNRHVSMGFPFLANLQAGAFYPPHLSFLVLPFFDAIRFLFLFHYLVAALGSYFLCRQWSYPSSLSLIGSILFTFGGVLVSLANLLDHFQAAVWFPWVLLLGERAIRSQSWKSFLLLTFLSLLQFLAGSPEIYAMSLGVLLLDGLRLRAAEEVDITYRKLFFVFLGANALVAGLAMVQILPTIELVLHSWRAETVPYDKGSAWSLNPIRLINLFFLDKEFNPYAFNGMHLYFGRERPLLISLYLGAVALPAICLWLFESSRRERAILSGLTVISVILAMGSYTPVYPFLFEHLPFLGMVRFPEKFFFVSFVLLVFMVPTGLFRFLYLDTSPRRGALVILSSLPILVFLLPYLFLRFHSDTLIQLVAWVSPSSLIDVPMSKISSGILVHLERQILLVSGVSVILFLHKTGRLRLGLFGILLVGLTFLDLTSAHRPYLFPLDPNQVYGKPRIIDAPDNEPYRLFYIYNLSYLHPNYYRFSMRPFAETVSSVFATLIPNTGVFHGFDYMQELDALGRKSYNVFLSVANNLPPERLYRLLGVLNVKYLSSLQPLPPGDVLPLRHFPEYPSWLYRIDRVVPRTYIASKVIVDREPLKSLDRLSSAEFDPVREVILEEPFSIPPKNDFQAQARILRYANRHVTIQASLNGSGVLVLADSYYPGWRVYVDGKEQEIRRANLFFRGVPLSAGEHVVEFRYEPRSFTVGLSLSLVFLAVVMVWSIFLFISRKEK